MRHVLAADYRPFTEAAELLRADPGGVQSARRANALHPPRLDRATLLRSEGP